MKHEKQRTLAAKGWTATTVEDFLELTPEELAYIELKLELSRSLRERRQAASLSQQDLAVRLASSQSRVSKMELADTSVSLDLLVRALLSLGATTADIGQLFTFAGSSSREETAA